MRRSAKQLIEEALKVDVVLVVAADYRSSTILRVMLAPPSVRR